MDADVFIELFVNYTLAVAPLTVAYCILKRIIRAVFGAVSGRGFRL